MNRRAGHCLSLLCFLESSVCPLCLCGFPIPVPLTQVTPSPSVFDTADHERAGAVAEGGIDGFAAGDEDRAAGDGGAQVVEADRHAVRQQAVAVRGEVVDVDQVGVAADQAL